MDEHVSRSLAAATLLPLDADPGAAPVTLGSLYADRPAALLFLRHFG